MTSRREVLKVGLAVAALPATARAAFAAPSTVPFYKVLYDMRFSASVAFARRAQGRGYAVHAMAGDMTRFWYDDLFHAWRRDRVAIAGLTAHGALFCLERLAWDQGLRVVYRGEHAAAAGGCVVHRFEGRGAWVAAAAEAAAAPAWAAALADVVVDCPSGRAELRKVEASTRTPDTVSSEALYSWVIAPVAPA
jgi:hypothetical protein